MAWLRKDAFKIYFGANEGTSELEPHDTMAFVHLDDQVVGVALTLKGGGPEVENRPTTTSALEKAMFQAALD